MPEQSIVEVVVVYAPRPEHDKWMDYLPLIRLQRASVERLGHRHLIVSDQPVDGFNVLRAELPRSLMHAVLAGQLACLEQWSGDHHLVLADADVLIARDLAPAFDGTFDIGLTNRIEPESPINNGVMYVAAGARDAALRFFTAAYALCGEHWGGDQQAISQAAAPVPDGHCVQMRHGARIGFLPPKRYNMTPGVNGVASDDKAYAVHFKGERKHRMKPYADRFLK